MADHGAFNAQAHLERLIAQLAVAINTRALYEPNHPRFLPAIRNLIEGVVAACDDRKQDSITFLLLGDELVVDQRPLRRGGLHQEPIIRTLKRRGIERLTLGRGLEPSECYALIEALAVGGVPASTANVIVGQVEIALPPEEGSEDQLGARMDAARESFLQFRTERRAGLRKLEDLMWSFIDALTRSTKVILPLVPLKSHDEYTFVHSINVALLVLAQARSFGIQGQMLHSVGLAALLHDVGKLSIPLEVLNKPGRLEGEEWTVMMSHAELGARQLCQIETSHPVAILVAYEHHMRFDGQPNYPVLKTPRRPTLASQMTALADVYDAICTARPYRGALPPETALNTLRSRAGTFHDPFLVGNFCRLLRGE